MIILDQLTHIHPGGRRVLDALSLHVRTGEFCVLSGVNGAGKSTLFRILCGLLRPSAGRAVLDGKDLRTDLDGVRRVLGVVFQNPAVDRRLTVLENLRLHAGLYGIRGRDFETRLEETLGWSELADRLSDRVGILSGGLSRQVELVKSLLTRPRILLLDEPTTGLDPASRHNFLATLRRLQQGTNMTILMTSHIFSEAASADRMAVLQNGVILACDSPAVLKARLGQDLLVIDAVDAAGLEEALRTTLKRGVQRIGDEIRVEVGDSSEGLALMETIVGSHRAAIRGISLKQPTMEDVFIHLTGKRTGEHDA